MLDARDAGQKEQTSEKGAARAGKTTGKTALSNAAETGHRRLAMLKGVECTFAGRLGRLTRTGLRRSTSWKATGGKVEGGGLQQGTVGAQ